MLNSLCCSTTMMNNGNTTTSAVVSSHGHLSTTSVEPGMASSNPTASVSMNINSSSCKQNSTTMVNNDLLFLYDNDLQENRYLDLKQEDLLKLNASLEGASKQKQAQLDITLIVDNFNELIYRNQKLKTGL